VIFNCKIQRSNSFNCEGSEAGGWQAVPVQTKASAVACAVKVLANGSTAPAVPMTILFG
jgi:hypothetical protein